MINKGRFRLASNVLHRYSAIMPNEIFVIPKPTIRIDINAGQPAARSSNNNFLSMIYIVHAVPIIKNKIPTIDTILIGAKENATKESINNFIFLENVHFDLPTFRSCLS